MVTRDKLVEMLNQLERFGEVNASERQGFVDHVRKLLRDTEDGMVDKIVSECRQEMTKKDERIAFLEKEVTRVFSPVCKFWNEGLDGRVELAEKTMANIHAFPVDDRTMDYVRSCMSEYRRKYPVALIGQKKGIT